MPIGFKRHWSIGITCLAYLCWSTWLERVHELPAFMITAYSGVVDKIFSQPLWRLLLPQPDMTGSYSATGLLLFHKLQLLFHSTGLAYQLAHLMSSVSLYFAIYWIFSSRTAAFFSALLWTFSTHNYHMYSVSGSTMLALVSTYTVWTLFFTVRYIQSGHWKTGAAALFSLSWLFLSYEGWLDVFCWMLLILPLWNHWLRKKHWVPQRRRMVQALAVLIATGILYISIKTRAGDGQGPGSESDLVFNYPSITVMVEDLVSNLFKQNYLVLSNFWPPFLGGSNSLLFYDSKWLIEQQKGYHAEFSHLAYMNHLFLWRYYAGIAMAIVAFWGFKLAMEFRKRHNLQTLVLLSLLLAIPFGSATHTVTKFRPFNSVPFLGYHVWFGVLCSTILFGLLLSRWLLSLSLRAKRRTFAACILYTLFVAAVRPIYLNQMVEQLKMGRYPQPIQNLIHGLRR